MDYTLFEIFSYIVPGYFFSTVIFHLLLLFTDQAKNIRLQYLDRSNSLIMILSAVFYILYLAFIIININSSSNYVSEKKYLLNTILFSTITTLLIPMLFLVKKFRLNIFITLLVAFSLWLFTHKEEAIIMVTNFYRDYITSAWSVYTPAASWIKIAIATLLYFSVVYFSVRKSRPVSRQL